MLAVIRAYKARSSFAYTQKRSVIAFSPVVADHFPRREKARKWYWKNRNMISEEHKQNTVILVEEGKVIKSFDSLGDANSYQQYHVPWAYLTVVGKEGFDYRY